MTPSTRLRNVGLYPRLVVAFVVVALLPLTVAYWTNVADTRSEAQTLARDLLTQVATVQQRRLNLEFKHLQDQLALIASRTQMRRSLNEFALSGDPGARALVEQILSDALQSSPDVQAITLHHADGRTVVAIPAETATTEKSDSESSIRFLWNRDILTGVALTAPLILDDRPIGTIDLHMSLERMRAMLNDFSEANIGGRTLLVLQTPDHRLMPIPGSAAPDALDEMRTAQQWLGAISTAVAGAQHATHFDPERHLLYTYLSLDAPRSGALVYMQLERLQSTLTRQRTHLTLEIMFLLTLSILTAAMLARMISGPIRHLIQQTRRLQDGDLGARIETPQWGEFDLLADAFNSTAATLQAHTDTLQAEIETRQAAQRELLSMANTDPLTGLFNRRYFLDALNQRAAACTAGELCSAILFIDLDAFKPINDQYGHEAGDVTLQIVAQRLLNLVRSEDCVARIGGDEFVILLRDPDRGSDPASIVERISQSLAQPIIHQAHQIKVGASVGMARLKPGMRAEQLLALGDSRMYEIKLAKRIVD